MKREKLTKIVSAALTVLIAASLSTGCQTSSSTSVQSSGKVSADEPGWKKDTTSAKFDWYINFSWFASKWGTDVTTKYITKKTGVDLNLISPAGNEAQKLNTMIASNTLPDFITLDCNDDAVKKLEEGGLVYSLNELATKYDPYFNKVADKAKLNWYTRADGNVYAYPNSSSSPKDFEKYKDQKPSNETFLVRKDMYEALGKPDMRTPEGFLNALKAAKQKFPNIDGSPLIPLGLTEFNDKGNYALQDYIGDFLALPKSKNGKLYDRTTDPEYIKWLKTFREANSEGLLAKDVFVDKRSQMEEKIAQGRYFAMLYLRSDLQSQEIARYTKDPKSIYIAVDGPANSKLDAPKLSGDGISGWTVTLISKNCKNPKKAIEFLTYLISEEGQKDLYLGQKGVTYDTINGKDQLKPEVLDLLNKDRISFDKKYGVSYTYWMLMDTNMMLKWAIPTSEALKQMEDWTKGKTVSYSQYASIDPPADSSEGIINTKVQQLWGKTLPKLLLASSSTEFDSIFNDFKTQRKALGYDKVMDYQQKQYESNCKKLSLKP